MRFHAPDLAARRAALLDLQTTPVEIDTLLVYPTVVGMLTAGPALRPGSD